MGQRRGRQKALFTPCVYCGDIADSKDHVPPKVLLETPYPPNLCTVPACRACNASYADDERYYRDAMAHVGFVPLVSQRRNLRSHSMMTSFHAPLAGISPRGSGPFAEGPPD